MNDPSVRCDGYADYRGTEPPTCNNGNPCIFCSALYETLQRLLLALDETTDPALTKKKKKRKK